MIYGGTKFGLTTVVHTTLLHSKEVKFIFIFVSSLSEPSKNKITVLVILFSVYYGVKAILTLFRLSKRSFVPSFWENNIF